MTELPHRKNTSGFFLLKRKKLHPSLSTCCSLPSHHMPNVEDAHQTASSIKHSDNMTPSNPWGRVALPRLQRWLAEGPGIANWLPGLPGQGDFPSSHMMSPAHCKHVRDRCLQPEISDMNPSSLSMSDQPQKCTPPLLKCQGRVPGQPQGSMPPPPEYHSKVVSSLSYNSSSRNTRMGMQTMLEYKPFL